MFETSLPDSGRRKRGADCALMVGGDPGKSSIAKAKETLMIIDCICFAWVDAMIMVYFKF